MRKYLLLITTLCLHIAARGQTVINLADIDISGLPQPTQVKSLRYWFDDDDGTVQNIARQSGTFSLDVSALAEGVHTLHYQIVDGEETPGYVRSTVFLKVDERGVATAGNALRYWFDDNNQAVTLSSAGIHTLDVSTLLSGLHTIHYQVVGSGGQVYYMASSIFLKTGSDNGTGTVLPRKLLYWFDDEVTIRQANISDGIQMLDASELLEGLHTLHYQVLCNNGEMTPSVSSIFLRVNTSVEITVAKSFRYWFDDEEGATVLEITTGERLLDATRLKEGLHVLHYQPIGNNGILGAPMSSLFLKMETGGAMAQTVRYWFDDEKNATEQEITTGERLLDATRLSDGLHVLHYQAVGSDGILGSPMSSLFMKMDAGASMAKNIRYWFDDDASSVRVTDVANGTQTLDVPNLLTGMHTLCYQLVDDSGNVSAPVTRLFLKNFDKVIEGGQNRVTKYQYWLNMNSQAMQTVELDAAANPYTLIALLPMQKEPIQSSQFHFEVTNDVPTIYAKNTLHVRFYDAQNYFSDGEKPFVDYSVKQEVTDLIALNNGDHKTIASPEENTIQWFKFYAEEGDTVTFKTDQAASIQVFSPEGKEIYSAAGSTSVKYGGCHTWIDGTYYVALHDVTGSRPNISLDFTHLAKYDVVDYDVAAVGNGGCSTITFKGNGFKDLFAVDFVNAANDSIHAFSIGHESDGTTSVTADFTDAAIGKYTALFHFTEGKKYVYDAITVEEAMPIELATEVTFPRSFGHVVTYTCKITNNGNMTAYAVPIYTWLKSKRLDGIYHIDYDGLDLAGAFDGVVTDSLTESEIAELRARSKELGDDHHFLKFWTEDEDHPGDSVFVRSNYFFTNIAPYETKTLRLTISTREVDTYAYFTVPEDWPSYQVAQVEGVAGARARFRAPSLKDKYCCIRNRVECIANLVADGTSIANEILQYAPDLTTQMAAAAADCVASAASKIISTAGTVMCDDDSVEKNFWDKVHAALDGTSTTGMLTSCISKLPLPWKKIQAILDAIGKGAGGVSMAFGLGVDMADCAIAFTSKIPGCPPPPPGGGGAQGGKSHDPNEIYGYLAESGSKFMTNEVEKVNYRIEFENDPAFATRSAMTVVIRDTLDSKLFDLATYAPSGIKIGEKVEFLDGEPNFVKTIDMRPEINGLVEVEGKYNATKGILIWTFTSIDPMTMEPTNDPMDGFLPVNVNGNGIGEVTFDIALKQKLAEGTEIPNRAGIVFDINDVILTPTWTNTVDATAPESHVANVVMATDTTAAVSIAATDELSGPWRYNVYVQYGDGAWFLGAENVPIDKVANVKVYEGIDHGFYTVVTDSAGNVEQKEAAREFTLEVFAPQVETNTKIELAQGWNWISHNQQEVLAAEALKPKAQRIVSQTDELFKDSRFGWTGDLEELLPTQMYKVQMTETAEVQLSGLLFNAAFRSIPLREGWNWIGYPVAMTMTPAEALAKFDAEEDDAIIGRNGLTTYSDGQWLGTLTEMQPGQGYMFRSMSDKSLFLNATAQTSSRRVGGLQSVTNPQYPDNWVVDKQKYPNVMGVVAELYQDDKPVGDSNEWLLGAFCGDECRGLAQTVGNRLMMNVYGQGGEKISFYVMHRESGEILSTSESEDFRSGMLGTVRQPYVMNIGVPTGITTNSGSRKVEESVYDLQGRKVDAMQSQKGVYIVTDGKNGDTQKVVRK